MKFASRALAPLLTTLLLVGCGDRVELHSHLSEQDANEVVAELADKHILADKRQAKDGVSVLVAAEDINRAVRALDAAGLPHRQRTSLGEIFRKEGVISTPLEERARYLYALSQELEATLSQIDGVVTARVHVVLPERVAPGEPVQPASASVFIKHTPALDPESTLPRIRRLVASSIPGMASETESSRKLAIVFVPAAPYREAPSLAGFGPFLIPQEDLAFWRLVGWSMLVGLVALSALVLTLLGWRRRRIPASTPAVIATSAPAGQVIAPAAFRRRDGSA